MRPLELAEGKKANRHTEGNHELPQVFVPFQSLPPSLGIGGQIIGGVHGGRHGWRTSECGGNGARGGTEGESGWVGLLARRFRTFFPFAGISLRLFVYAVAVRDCE
jgi:hypothetical protein